MVIETRIDTDAAEFAKTLAIPPCPDIVAKIVRESATDEPDLKKIGLLVTQDMALAATVLHTVNSPFYGLRSPIQSIQQALMVLGLRTVKSLVIGLLLKQAFPKVQSPGMQRFWRDNSRAAALGAFVSREIAVDRDLAYTYGLFRRCGMPVLRTNFEDYEPIIAGVVPERRRSLLEVERERYGINHAQLGAHLAGGWLLAPETCDAIRHAEDYPVESDLRSGAKKGAVRLAALGVIVDVIDDRMQGVDCRYTEEVEFALDCLDVSAETVDVLVAEAPKALA